MGLNCGLRSSKAAIAALSPSAGRLAGDDAVQNAGRGGRGRASAFMRRPRVDGRSGHANAGVHAIDPVDCRDLLGRLSGRARRRRQRVCRARAPSPWQLGFQQSASPVMDDIIWFHNFVLRIIIAITLFVLALLLIVIVRFNAKANPAPSQDHAQHAARSGLDGVPVLILVVIAIPSFRSCSCSSTSRRPTSPSRRPASSGTGPTTIRTTATSTSTRSC